MWKTPKGGQNKAPPPGRLMGGSQNSLKGPQEDFREKTLRGGFKPPPGRKKRVKKLKEFAQQRANYRLPKVVKKGKNLGK